MHKQAAGITARDWLPYPKEDAYRGGCKVSWHYYADEETAAEAAKIANHNRIADQLAGYDHGFCVPGSVRKVETGEHAGLIEVCTC